MTPDDARQIMSLVARMQHSAEEAGRAERGPLRKAWKHISDVAAARGDIQDIVLRLERETAAAAQCAAILKGDGDWVSTVVDRQPATLNQWVTGGETWTVRFDWVPRNAAYCFWLGKDGEARGEAPNNTPKVRG